MVTAKAANKQRTGSATGKDVSKGTGPPLGDPKGPLDGRPTKSEELEQRVDSFHAFWVVLRHARLRLPRDQKGKSLLSLP